MTDMTAIVTGAGQGFGLVLTEVLAARGATVIGTVGSEAKKAIALQHGCHHVIDYRREDFAQRTLELTGGARARLDALAPEGHAIDIHLTMTDDYPWAQAFVILQARKLEP